MSQSVQLPPLNEQLQKLMDDPQAYVADSRARARADLLARYPQLARQLPRRRKPR